MEIISRTELNHQDKDLLERIIAKSPKDLNANELLILRARQIYLTAVERVAFAEVLENKKEEVNKKKK